MDRVEDKGNGEWGGAEGEGKGCSLQLIDVGGGERGEGWFKTKSVRWKPKSLFLICIIFLFIMFRFIPHWMAFPVVSV